MSVLRGGASPKVESLRPDPELKREDSGYTPLEALDHGIPLLTSGGLSTTLWSTYGFEPVVLSFLAPFSVPLGLWVGSLVVALTRT